MARNHRILHMPMKWKDMSACITYSTKIMITI
jgi:hypothetical protein